MQAILHAYRELINNLLKNITFDDGIYQLCSFLVNKIPSDKLLWYRVQRSTMTMDIMVDYSRGGESIDSYSRKIPFIFEESTLQLLRHPQYDTIHVCQKVASVPPVYEYMRTVYGSVFNSMLCFVSPFGENTHQVQGLCLMSLNINAYSEEQIALFASLQEIFLDISARLFSRQDTLSFSMADRGKVNFSSEKLLRRCKSMQELMKQIEAVAKTKVPVFIQGETGVGKELVADAIHSLSAIKHGPFVKVNCGALTESLVDSELFGHEKGAFTGATSSRIGFFEQANNGTLFLDEIGELSLSAQTKLLRTLEVWEIRRVGGVRNIPVNVRIITATNRDLQKMVKDGQFREELLYRFNVFPITIPSLDQRKEDIPFLAEHFYSMLVHEQEIEKAPLISREFIDTLKSMHWAGNIRQLKHTIERAFIMSYVNKKRFLELAEVDCRPEISSLLQKKSKRGRPSVRTISKENIIEALTKAKGKIQGENGAAALLQIPPSSLRKYMKDYGISRNMPV